jgi:hypothetical protein
MGRYSPPRFEAAPAGFDLDADGFVIQPTAA